VIPFVESSVYTLEAWAANLVGATACQAGEACTLEWLGVVLGFPCERITPIAVAVIAMALLGITTGWAVRHMLRDASEFSFTIKWPRK